MLWSLNPYDKLINDNTMTITPRKFWAFTIKYHVLLPRSMTPTQVFGAAPRRKSRTHAVFVVRLYLQSTYYIEIICWYDHRRVGTTGIKNVNRNTSEVRMDERRFIKLKNISKPFIRGSLALIQLTKFLAGKSYSSPTSSSNIIMSHRRAACNISLYTLHGDKYANTV